jgi:hypothetical protein
MQLHDRWTSIEFKRLNREVRAMSWTDIEDFLSKYGPDTNPKAYDKVRSLGSFYEGIGVLVNRKLIEPAMVDDLMSNGIVSFWEQFGPALLEYRKRNWPQAAEWVEYLYNVIKPIVEEQHPERRT